MTADTESGLDQAIERLFDYWADGADRRWGRHAWGLLAAAGVVSSELAASGPRRAEQLITLSALALLSGQFWSLVYCGTEEGFEVSVLVGESALLTEVELGRYADEHGIRQASFVNAAELTQFLAAEALPGLLTQLSGIQNMSTWLAELWAQRTGGEYPLTDQALADLFSNPSVDLLTAFSWLDQLWPIRELSASVSQ